MELTGRDIVIIGLQPWYYEIGSNCKTIATYLAQHNRVLYVNLPINRKTFMSKDKNPGIQEHCNVIKGKGKQLRPIKDNMWQYYPTCIVESINGLPSNKAFNAINYINNRRYAKDIKNAISELNFKDVILFNDNDIYNGFYLKELLKPNLYIYYCRDFLQGYDYWKKHVSILEPRLIAKADIAVANSLFYAGYCKEHNPNAHYMGQGCNFDLFNTDKPHETPEELKNIKRPIIGYVGAVDSARLDPKILETIAKTNEGWSLVIVGPEDPAFESSDLHQLPNIHWLGRRPLQALPDYVAGFDVCINPQLINIITKGNYPLKIDEYLAMGKPVVATRTKTMELFQDYTYLAETPEAYPGLIEEALKHPVNKDGEAFARSHTWENCMQTLYDVIATK